MVEHELELPFDAVPAVVVCERALTGRVGSWARPWLGRPERRDGVDDEEELDEARLHAQAEALLDSFAAQLTGEPESLLLEHGASVADTMLMWKIGYGDRRIERWTVADLAEFLLDWYPHGGDSRIDVVRAVPDSVVAFLRFLGEAGRLSGGDVDALETAVRQLETRFRRAANDPRNWGLAKTMVMQMRAEGVDPSEPGVLEAWVENFNRRSFDERDRVVAPARERMLVASRADPRRETRRKTKTRRRAEKVARRRNRR